MRSNNTAMKATSIYQKSHWRTIYRSSWILLFLITGTNSSVFSQKAIFLHHSTGAGVYNEGNVNQWIENYNSINQTQFIVDERSYPNDPYPWDNYPYDFWHLWVDNNCQANSSGIQCLDNLASQYGVIIFKHCFPGAGMNADNGTPQVNSSEKTLANYKLQYRALRDKFKTMPNTKFIVWTLAPLHRLSTDSESAKRAAEFVSWVKNDWLAENGTSPKNIFIFDFWGYTAETSALPANGNENCLKYDYERSHSDGDSHPNLLANQTIGPLFAQFIIDVFNSKTNSVSNISKATITMTRNQLIVNQLNAYGSSNISIYNSTGQIVWTEIINTSSFEKTLDLSKGVYEIVLQNQSGKKVQKMIIR